METKFSKRIESQLNAEVLWREVLAGIEHSEGHPFWPISLEKSETKSVHAGSILHVTYYFFLLARPVKYRVASFQPTKRLLTYKTTQDHPMRGTATIQVARGKRGGSALHWSGTYSHPWYSSAGIFLKTYFLPRFFHELEAGIRRFEQEQLASKRAG